MVCTRQQNIQQARLSKQAILEAAATLGVDPDAPMQLAILDNEIAEGDYKQNNEVPIKLLDSEKTQYNNDWRTYRERNALLMKHRGQAFSLILGQCTQLLQDRMKQDTNWNMASTSYNPLDLYRLIEKTTLAQMEDQYPFATVYDQELGFYSFRQETMSNPQWYEKFNTKVDVGSAIGVTQQHKVLLEYVAQENHTLAFTALSAEQKQASSPSGKGNLQMIKKTPHFLLNFLQISTIFASFSRAHAGTLQNPSISPCAFRSQEDDSL